MKNIFFVTLLFLGSFSPSPAQTGPKTNPAEEVAAAGWQTSSPREELKPSFAYEAQGGRTNDAAFVIQHDNREGLDGCWKKSFRVEGGHFYRFSAFRKTEHVPIPRRSALVRILWLNSAGQKVMRDEAAEIPPTTPLSRYLVDVLPGFTPTAEAEHPTDRALDREGWTEVSDAYRAPATAAQAVVELHLQWAPQGSVRWSSVALAEIPTPKPRLARLAAVHFQPKEGKTPADKCRLFAPFIAQAALERADLVVLPETLTIYSTGLSYAQCAEPIPGPSTDYFGGLAKRHNLYIVAGLVERSEHLVYNVAVLLAPDGTFAGKYRKVCLPRDEMAAGVAPGTDYPVFETRFGKLGLMVCYDGFFPEVARELSNRGAEVIAWPVWGCNPLLASARACENHVFLVSSTYEDPSHKWMLTGVWDQDGTPIAQAKQWGSVIVREVNLDQRLHWPSLGDFKGDLLRHRPASASEP